MRGRVHARRTLKGLVADLRKIKIMRKEEENNKKQGNSEREIRIRTTETPRSKGPSGKNIGKI